MEAREVFGSMFIFLTVLTLACAIGACIVLRVREFLSRPFCPACLRTSGKSVRLGRSRPLDEYEQLTVGAGVQMSREDYNAGKGDDYEFWVTEYLEGNPLPEGRRCSCCGAVISLDHLKYQELIARSSLIAS